MKDNYNTILRGEVAVLVPYRVEHVAQYHEWMSDESILQATASERLSLQEVRPRQKAT